jgi:hypothetical protein
MKTAEIKKTLIRSGFPPMEEISASLDKIKDRLNIDLLNWEGYSYKPEVSVAMSYSDNEIFLKYYVKEKYFKAEKTETNQMVCEDSCVEFFASPEEDGIYYNIEFNAIGTCLMGSGTERADSTRADVKIIAGIRRLTSVGEKPVAEKNGIFEWTITVAIPFNVFFRHKVKELKGKHFRANFYKCGDKLEVPHYVTWNKVATEKPDYHRPEYFGVLKFI